MSRGKRTRVATGIYRDAYGFAISVCVHGANVERRWPLGTPLETLKRARPKLLAELLDTAPMSRHKRTHRGELVAPAPPVGPTLREGLAAFLATLPEGSTNRENCDVLGERWLEALGGSTPLAEITGARLLTAFAEWKAAHQTVASQGGRGGHSASTLNKRRDVMRGIFRVAYGVAGINPTAELGPREQERAQFEVRSIPRTVIEYIFAAMGEEGRPVEGKTRGEAPALSKVRLRVMAETGFPPAILKRLAPRDVDYQAETVYVAGRFKGKKAVAPRTVPVTPAALEALRAFFALGASGPAWGSASLWQYFRRAVEKARPVYEREERLAWPAPENLRPYDLRHSFAARYYGASADEAATKEVLMHSPTSTVVARYIRGQVSANAVKGKNLLAQTAEVTGPSSALFSAPVKTLSKFAKR